MTFGTTRERRWLRAVLLTSLSAVSAAIGLSSCAEMGGALGAAAAGFRQNLVGAAGQNYGQTYSQMVADLLVAFAYKELELTRPNQPGQQYPQAYGTGSHPGGAYGQPQYGQSSYPQQGTYNDPYAGQNQGTYNDPYANQSQNQGTYNDPYANQSQNQGTYNDPYANQSQNQGTYNDPYANQSQNQGTYNDPYANQSQNQGTYDDPYADPGMDADPYQSQPGYGMNDPYAQQGQMRAGPRTIEMTAALLAQRRSADGSYRLEPIEDGATLRDGRGDPGAGDLFKVLVSVNCACYVYIIGIDATGYVAEIFPDSESGRGNPVDSDREYLLPDGTEWWGLDQNRGVEQIYFIASLRQRSDIEQQIDLLSRQPKVGTRGEVVPVTEPAPIASPRGLIKVQQAEPVKVATSNGHEAEVTPTSFSTTAVDADLVITRWFRHE